MTDDEAITSTQTQFLRWWHDYWTSQVMILRAVKRAPWFAAGLIYSAIFGALSANSEMQKYLQIPDWFCLTALSCFVISETWAVLGQTTPASKVGCKLPHTKSEISPAQSVELTPKAELEPQSDLNPQTNLAPQPVLESQSDFAPQPVLESQADFAPQPALESQADFAPQPALESQADFAPQPVLESQSKSTSHEEHSNRSAEIWLPAKNWRRWFSIYCASALLNIAVACGIALFVLPGVFLLFAGSLTLVFICVEKASAVEGLVSSVRLVTKNFWKSAAYLAPTVVLTVCALAILFFVVSIIFGLINPLFAKSNYYKAMSGGFILALEWAALSVTPLQVRLYKHLKLQGPAENAT